MARAEARASRHRAVARPDHIAWLHQGQPATRWGNLGLWTAGPDGRLPTSYAEACMALACAVGEAAGMQPDDVVLSLACGGGEELALWAERFGTAAVMGVESSPSLAAQARRRVEAAHATCVFDVQCADARNLPQLVHARFHRIVCVDALYHLGPRLPLLRAAKARLYPGGSMAFTDLVLERRPSAAWRRLALQAGAGLAGIAHGELRSESATLAQLSEAGFVDVQAVRLDEAVLAGFCRFADEQGRRIGAAARASSGWRRVAVTAWLIRTGLEAGLGYALYSGRVRAEAEAEGEATPARSRGAELRVRPAASTRATATSAERTALSSKGMPGCA